MIKRVVSHSVLFLVLSLLATPLVLAQANATGSLTGTVTDKEGGVIPGAEVLVKNDQTGFEYETVTNEMGVWEISSLPSGSYTVSMTAQGFRTATFSGIRVSIGTTVTVDADLQVGFTESVTVIAARNRSQPA